MNKHGNANIDIYIVGASGFAREVAIYVLDTRFYIIRGFIDKEIHASKNVVIRSDVYPVIDEKYFLDKCKSDSFIPNVVIAIGDPAIRSFVAKKYQENCSFPNIIHPSALLMDDDINLGKGNVISPGCVILTAVNIGDFNFLNVSVSVGHDVNIGNCNVFNSKVSIPGNVTVGNCNLFGANSSVIQGIKIGSDNVIGMGSVLLKGIIDGVTMFGVPARRIL
jgi:sugar O-acyltransferase (sialic acid O-acetyltransferase NeuD family)